MHWTCACQWVLYPDNSHAPHDARLPIVFLIPVLRELLTIGIKTVPCPGTAPHDVLPTAPLSDNRHSYRVFRPCSTKACGSGALS